MKVKKGKKKLMTTKGEEICRFIKISEIKVGDHRKVSKAIMDWLEYER